MSLAIALTPPLAALRVTALGATMVVAAGGEAAAQARRSSGGYSRPSMRTPSFSAPSYNAPAYNAPRPSPRAPSTSGGYSRPMPGRSPSVEAVPFSGGSEGDRAFSRERSSQALDARRAQEDAARRAQQQQQQQQQQQRQAPAHIGGGWFGGSPGYVPAFRQPNYPQQRPNWFAQQGWQAPSYAMGGQRSFGVWDGLFLWFMLDHLTRPGYGDFFRSHQSDPGYQQWRAEADRLATENADLKRKLDALDQQVAAAPQSPAPAALPADIPADVAAADPAKARTPSIAANDNRPGLRTVATVVLLGAAGLAYLAWRRRQAATPSPSRPSQGTGPMTPLKTAANLLRNAVSGQPYKPEHFRVGMTITADPTPFILAAGTTKVPTPEAPGGNMLLSVQAVGRVADGAASLVRLYLPDSGGANRRAMFQLHLDADGTPDECRYFGIIDEVSPADPNEWGAWLDRAEGMIGWPEFQTKDGRVYARIWAPGPQRIAPRVFDEVITSADGSETVRHQAMLYAGPTGAAAPAPETEYILVSAIQRQSQRQAWVEIRAGIDVNPAALSLA
jgi:hypothetical protein